MMLRDSYEIGLTQKRFPKTFKKEALEVPPFCRGGERVPTPFARAIEVCLLRKSYVKRSRSMAGHFQTLLEEIVANPHQKLSELPLFTAAERHELLAEWNNRKFVQIESSFTTLTTAPSLKATVYTQAKVN
jgi:hypothetical protein